MLDNAETSHDLVIDDTDEIENVAVSRKGSSVLDQVAKSNQDFAAGSIASTDTSGPSYRSADLFELYETFVGNCLFSIPVYSKLCIKKEVWRCELAQFQIHFSRDPIFVPLPTDNLPDRTEFSLYVSRDFENILSCETGKSKPTLFGKKKVKNNSTAPTDLKFWLVNADLPFDCLEALDCKSFQVVIDKFESQDKTVTLKIYGTEALLLQLSCPGESIRMAKKQNHSLKLLMEHFYGISAPGIDIFLSCH